MKIIKFSLLAQELTLKCCINTPAKETGNYSNQTKNKIKRKKDLCLPEHFWIEH